MQQLARNGSRRMRRHQVLARREGLMEEKEEIKRGAQGPKARLVYYLILPSFGLLFLRSLIHHGQERRF